MKVRSQLSILLLGAIAVTSSALRAQTASVAPVPPLTSDVKLIVFEVVSVRPNNQDTRHFQRPFSGDGMVLEYLTPQNLIALAYNLDPDISLISGLPEWAKSDRYDIRARVAESDVAAWKTYNEKMRWKVLQQVLSDRFRLKIHSETQQRPIYSLVVAKGGSKIKQVEPLANDPKGFVEPKNVGVEVGHHATMDAFVHHLSRSHFGLDRQVYDHTGLTGNYDFTLIYAPVRLSAGSEEGTASDPAQASIFTAIQEQLGLKLESTKGPVDVLVIDHIEKPTEN
ncbi:MAG TPA: TIGR03435 family protein [Acidobacteriaceae bacterium]